MYALEHGPGPDASVSGFREGDERLPSPEDWFGRRFRHWRGRSGRSYVFSVYSALDCPAYEDAVLIIAESRRAEALACLDLGRFPEARLSQLRRRFRDRVGEVEFQVHVLTERDGDRRSLIEDLNRGRRDA